VFIQYLRRIGIANSCVCTGDLFARPSAENRYRSTPRGLIFEMQKKRLH